MSNLSIIAQSNPVSAIVFEKDGEFYINSQAASFATGASHNEILETIRRLIATVNNGFSMFTPIDGISNNDHLISSSYNITLKGWGRVRVSLSDYETNGLYDYYASSIEKEANKLLKNPVVAARYRRRQEIKLVDKTFESAFEDMETLDQADDEIGQLGELIKQQMNKTSLKKIVNILESLGDTILHLKDSSFNRTNDMEDYLPMALKLSSKSSTSYSSVSE